VGDKTRAARRPFVPNQSAKIDLANMMIRKAGLIRTVRDELAKQGVVYWTGLTEILDAVERARSEESGEQPR
jgi:hypothetical protein